MAPTTQPTSTVPFPLPWSFQPLPCSAVHTPRTFWQSPFSIGTCLWKESICGLVSCLLPCVSRILIVTATEGQAGWVWFLSTERDCLRCTGACPGAPHCLLVDLFPAQTPPLDNTPTCSPSGPTQDPLQLELKQSAHSRQEWSDRAELGLSVP